jgi:fluoride exporter
LSVRQDLSIVRDVRDQLVHMTKYLAVLAGGAFGTGLRYFLSTFIYSVIKEPTFPYANLVINVSGSFALGLLTELFAERLLVSPTVRVAVLTGILGGYTTFSSFSYETYSLLRDGEMWRAILNAVGSVLLGLIAVWLGVRLAQQF